MASNQEIVFTFQPGHQAGWQVNQWSKSPAGQLGSGWHHGSRAPPLCCPPRRSATAPTDPPVDELTTWRVDPWLQLLWPDWVSWFSTINGLTVLTGSSIDYDYWWLKKLAWLLSQLTLTLWRLSRVFDCDDHYQALSLTMLGVNYDDCDWLPCFFLTLMISIKW